MNLNDNFQRLLSKIICTVVSFLLCKMSQIYMWTFPHSTSFSLFKKKNSILKTAYILRQDYRGKGFIPFKPFKKLQWNYFLKIYLFRYIFYCASSISTVNLIILTNIFYVFLFWYLEKYFSIIVMIMLDIKLCFILIRPLFFP